LSSSLTTCGTCSTSSCPTDIRAPGIAPNARLKLAATTVKEALRFTRPAALRAAAHRSPCV
jgi:hypothetical protein